MDFSGKEVNNRRLHIPELISNIKKLVEFIYRDSIENRDSKQAVVLLQLSDMYEFPSLQSASMKFISELSIDSENAVDI